MDRQASRDEPSLREIGEDALVDLLSGMVRRLEGKDVVVGSGDDCAVLESAGSSNGATYLLFKTDCVVEGVHYVESTPPSKVGWKAMARCLSDIAAMGGTPSHALVTLVLHGSRRVAYARGLYLGLRKAAKAFGVSLVGGETSGSTAKGQAMLSISMLGVVETKHCVLRSGGRPGHVLYVTSRLGGSLRGKHLKFTPRLEEARWLAKRFKPSAMMDLSDGLARDLPRMAAASKCGFEIEENLVPRTRGCGIDAALNDGEDYELLMAVVPAKAKLLELEWKQRFRKLPLTRIGKLTKSSGKAVSPDCGWQHFRSHS